MASQDSTGWTPKGPVLRYEDGIPVVPIVASRNPGEKDSLILQACPYCGEQHLHGAGGPGKHAKGSAGHRVSHCLKEVPGDRGYLLEVVAEKNSPTKRKARS